MSEVEKMYKLVGVKEGCTLPNLCRYKGICAKPVNCEHYDYPDFTAEKQLSLIKWLMVNFNEALAELINLYWQDLTEQERTEIAEILRG